MAGFYSMGWFASFWEDFSGRNDALYMAGFPILLVLAGITLFGTFAIGGWPEWNKKDGAAAPAKATK
jgi:hypothetical protein